MLEGGGGETLANECWKVGEGEHWRMNAGRWGRGTLANECWKVGEGEHWRMNAGRWGRGNIGE